MIEIKFHWAGQQSRIEILDDGIGMDEHELVQAMRLGEKSPLSTRTASDLGRFGMGLKTASFSQCRSLTVSSQKSQITTLRWDLDLLAEGEGRDWLLLEGSSEAAAKSIEKLTNQGCGTLVVWEKLDRIVTEEFSEQNFLDLIDAVERHFAMIFHRYIEEGNIRIRLNGKAVPPWDPFLTNHPATQQSPIERLRFKGKSIEVQYFVLPHKDRLDEATYKTAGGPDGWTAHQGFYVYRGRRLLVAGSWLSLGKGLSWTKEEAHRLARIRVDLPNNMDEDWKIDIRKSTARPPVALRAKLTNIAEQARRQARLVFAYRGSPASRNRSPAIASVWIAEQTKKGMKYRISMEHPAIQQLFEEAGSTLPQLKTVIRILEETVPVQRIWLDTAESKEAPPNNFVEASTTEIRAVLQPMFRSLVSRKGYTPEHAKEYLRNTEPFQAFPEIIDSLTNQDIS